jgi:hypothetical protein
MSAIPEVVEAHVVAQVLRATARALRGEHGGLHARLNRAADVLDGVVVLVMRSLERIEQLEGQVRKLKAGEL